MRPAVAIAELEKLAAEADPKTLFEGGGLASWKPKVRSVLVASLGADNDIVRKFDRVRFSMHVMYTAHDRARYAEQDRANGRRQALGLIEAAIFELQLVSSGEPMDNEAYDRELWAKVKPHVENGEWNVVASQTAIFVEDRVRTWAGSPLDRVGNHLVGKALYSKVFGETSEYRLGGQAAEVEGWRMLAIGFAQAISNVDRHHIRDRNDAKRYALGVLGLGSLLLTQMRYQHGEILNSTRSVGAEAAPGAGE